MAGQRCEPLYQLHWQSWSDPSQTELVAQTGADCDVLVVLNEVIHRRIAECPDGWGPMVCDDTSGYFVWAANPPQV
jgi:SH3-like domain-containing protein